MSQNYQDEQWGRSTHKTQISTSLELNLHILQQNLGQFHKFVLDAGIKVEGPTICDHVCVVYKNSYKSVSI